MVNANLWWRSLRSGCVVSSLLALTSSVGHAQTPPAEAPPAAAEPAPTAPVAVEPAPAVIAPPQTTIPAEVPPPPPPPPPALVEPPPPPPPAADKDPRKSPMTMNAWLRLGTRLQGFKDPESPNRLAQDGELDLLINAEIIEMIGLTGNLVGSFGPTPGGGAITGDVNIMDLIARFDIADPFHVWVGRMLVPSDRSNFSGPWFMSPWHYPGFFVPFSAPLGPRQGPNGRNDGITVWGQAAGGMFKYYAGAFELYNSDSAPLFSGRLSLSLLNPEPGYYGNSTFYGEKDILGIGIGLQTQKNGSVEVVDEDETADADTFVEFNADILFEKKLGDSGTLTLEGAFYLYEGDYEAVDYSYFALFSYLIPGQLGPGAVQPLVRLQQAQPSGEDVDAWTLLDIQLGYIVSSFACRFALGYQYSEVLEQKGHSVFLGIQLQK
jgi:hypothetical protein